MQSKIQYQDYITLALRGLWISHDLLGGGVEQLYIVEQNR